jgi:hypothetical protein
VKRPFGERWQFGDPQEVLERAQNETCAGCRQIRERIATGKKWYRCRLDMRDPAGSMDETARCALYEEKVT